MVRCDEWECPKVEQVVGNVWERRRRWKLLRSLGWTTYRDDNTKRLDLCPRHGEIYKRQQAGLPPEPNEPGR